MCNLVKQISMAQVNSSIFNFVFDFLEDAVASGSALVSVKQ